MAAKKEKPLSFVGNDALDVPFLKQTGEEIFRFAIDIFVNPLVFFVAVCYNGVCKIKNKKELFVWIF